MSKHPIDLTSNDFHTEARDRHGRTVAECIAYFRTVRNSWLWLQAKSANADEIIKRDSSALPHERQFHKKGEHK